jgi:hypothetical protein
MAINDFPRDHGSLSGLSNTDHHTQYALVTTGLASARPTAPYRSGRGYFATDTGLLSWDQGAGWVNPTLAGGSTVTSTAAATTGLVVKGATSQSANLQEWQNSGGTVLTSVDSGGSVHIGAGSTGFSTGVALGVIGSVAGSTLMVVRGAASQSTNLQEWQNSSGTPLSKVAYDGALYLTTAGASGSPLNIIPTGTGVLSAYISTSDATGKGLIVRGSASQTGNLQEWQNSSGTALGWINANGSQNWNNSYISAETIGDVAHFVAHVAGQKGLTVQGFAGQTANLQEWQNSSGTVLSLVDSAGRGQFTSFGVQGNPSGIAYAYLAAGDASSKALVVRGFASQTGNLTEWQNSSGTVLAGIGANGIWMSSSTLLAGSATAGSASALPSLPANYLFIQISGTNYKIPLYN